jgi:hypothetical protein
VLEHIVDQGFVGQAGSQWQYGLQGKLTNVRVLVVEPALEVHIDLILKDLRSTQIMVPNDNSMCTVTGSNRLRSSSTAIRHPKHDTGPQSTIATELNMDKHAAQRYLGWEVLCVCVNGL